MADLFSVTAPLLLRTPDGASTVMVERFPLAQGDGLVYFEMYWHLQRPASHAIHRIEGEVKGEGPWKIGDAVITVLGCQGTHPEFAAAFSEWQSFLQQAGSGYPDRSAIESLARECGARIG